MQIYFANLQAIELHTMQLETARCPLCHQERQLVSHGYIYKKRVQAPPERVGKRVFCSTRNLHTGCGRTVQLYLDATIARLHHGAALVAAFLLALIDGDCIAAAYRGATGADSPRNAYRWLNRMFAQLSRYRSLEHRPVLPDNAPLGAGGGAPRRACLVSSFTALRSRFGPSPCAQYQLQTQHPFL